MQALFRGILSGGGLRWVPFAAVTLGLAWGWAGPSQRPEQAPTPRSLAADRAAAAAISPTSLIVDFRDDVTAETLASNGIEEQPVSRYSQVDRLYRVEFASAGEAARAMANLARDPSVESVDYDVFVQLSPDLQAARRPPGLDRCDGKGAAALTKGFPDDPCFQYQWHLNQIGLPTAWKAGQGAGAVVAVIDTGVTRVADLEDVAFATGYNFVADTADSTDDHGHGTHVAGTIAQATHNGRGVAGVAFKATIMPLKVLDGSGRGSMAAIAQAIRYAADNGAHVVNMSLGGPFPVNTIASAVSYARKKGVTVIAAAGNDGRGRVSYPARYPDVIAVAATQFDESTTFYSNWGKQIDVAAPGGNVRVDQNGDGLPDGVLQHTVVPGAPGETGYLYFMGTSMASPHVAGLAALVVGAGVTKPDAVEKILINTARRPRSAASQDGARFDDHYGAGIVDAGKALAATRKHRDAGALALAATLAFGAFGRRRRSGKLGLAAGVVLGASGLFALPMLGVPLPSFLTMGAPLALASLLSANAFGSPLLLSALLPVAAIGLGFGIRRARPLLAGFAFGVAGLLASLAVLDIVDVSFVPDVFDRLWLLGNAVVCGLVGWISGRDER